MIRGRALVAALLAVSVSLLGCDGETGGGAPGASRPMRPGCTADPQDAAQALFDVRARALQQNRPSSFATTIASGRGAAEQRAWFRRLSTLGVDTVEIERSVAPTDGADSRRRYDLYSYVRVRLADYDRGPASVSHRTTLVRRAGCWKVAADRVEPGNLNDSLWDQRGAIATVRGPIGLLSNESAAVRERTLALAVRSWDDALEVLPRLGTPPPRHVLVAGFSSPTVLKELGLFHSLSQTGAITYPVLSDTGGVVARRVVIAPDVLSQGSPEGQALILRHEFVHVQLGGYASAPTWAVEGVAEFYSRLGNGLTAGLGPVPSGTTLIDGRDFYDDPYTSYPLAWSAMQVVADLKGDDEPAHLISALALAGGGQTERADRVLTDRYGFDLAGLAERARARLYRL